MKSTFLLVALLMASPAGAQLCPKGQCPTPPWNAAPRWQAVPLRPGGAPGNRTPRFPSLQRVRAATCRILHETSHGRSWGSGTLVNTENAGTIVLTCAHLFRDGAGKTRVWFTGGGAHSATLIDLDTNHDLAALKIDLKRDEHLPSTSAVDIADHAPPAGVLVHGCGFGKAGRFRCQSGTVLGYARSQHAQHADTLLYVGAARQGDSGGGVFDQQGKLVAVVWGTDERRTMATAVSQVHHFLRSIVSRLRRGRPAPPQPKAPPLAPVPNGPAVVPKDPGPVADSPSENMGASGGDGESRAFGRQLLELADHLHALRQRVEANEQASQAAAKQSTSRLDSMVGTLSVIQQRLEVGGRIVKGAAAATAVHPRDWLLPIVLGALGISAPPAGAIIVIKLLRCWLRRRLRKRRAPSTAQRRRRRRTPRRRLNDNYAEQLNSLMEYSGGRTVAQDATLGREYDRELRQAASRSGSPEVVQFADKLLRRVTNRFGRIHADNPVPAEPSATAT